MKHKIKVCKMPFGDKTEQGEYYATVDGETVGDKELSHWKTYSEAFACARRFVMNLENRT
jgi:hypothetical protein